MAQNGKYGSGYLPQANGNGLSGNTVISRDTLILLPEGEPLSNGKIKEHSTDSNEVKDNVQVYYNQQNYAFFHLKTLKLIIFK